MLQGMVAVGVGTLQAGTARMSETATKCGYVARIMSIFSSECSAPSHTANNAVVSVHPTLYRVREAR